MSKRFFLEFGAMLMLAGLASNLWAQTPMSVDSLRAQGARVSTNSPAATPARFVGFDADKLTITPADPALQRLPAQAAAVQHLGKYATLFGLRDVTNETQTKKHVDSPDGRAMTRFQQTYLGLPVIGGEIIVNQTAKRQLSSITGRISPDIKLSASPTITIQQATETALDAVAKWYGIKTNRLQASAPALSVYDARLISPFSEPLALVWHLEVRALDALPVREVLFINAETGMITVHFNQIAHARDRMTFDANSSDPELVTPTLVCDEANATCAGIADAQKAHRYSGTTYEYYKNKLGRDSIDGAGMTLISHVRICPAGETCPYENAFWDGSKMSYGEGFAEGEDVVAHELTHGVTEKESNLFYYYQSGAINESLSDVFGEFVQQSNVSEPVSPTNRWLMGENLTIGGAIRSMADPTLFRDPDKMTSTHYYLGSGDGGGVHSNSGVNNKAAYLMVDGGTFNGRTISPLGLVKTGLIYYRVQTNLLTSGSDYLDLHNGLYQACQDLINVSGITAQDCSGVRNATLAVEMNLNPSASFMPSANMCPAGQVFRTNLFSDGLENGGAQWLGQRALGTTSWSISLGYAASGLKSLYGPAPGSTSDLREFMASPVVLPANAHLWFNHAFQFERSSVTFYDGAVLEYSINGGTTWVDAASLYTEGQNYGGVISSSYGNPLRSRNAFVGESHGYVSSRYSLASLAGQSVQFRWRIGADSSIGALGWLVDDVSIHTCGTLPVAPGVPTNLRVASHPGRVTISFTPPGSSGSSAITGYTASCSAQGQVTRIATGTSSPISVFNLTPNVGYTCSVAALNSETSSSASAQVRVVGPKRVDLTPILMLLLN
jgi:bacillolysin